RIAGQRYSVTFKGDLAGAKKRLRELLTSGDTGTHIEPDKLTVGDWLEEWIGAGCPGNQKKSRVGNRSLDRYTAILRTHVVPALGQIKLQKLSDRDIDRFYLALDAKQLAPGTRRYVHIVFNSALNAARRKALILVNPVDRSVHIPAPVESDHGKVLETDQFKPLLALFKGTSLYPIVATALGTGARRGEILALRWSDLDPVAKTLRIERATEEAKGRNDARARRFKGPKSDR